MSGVQRNEKTISVLTVSLLQIITRKQKHD